MSTTQEATVLLFPDTTPKLLPQFLPRACTNRPLSARKKTAYSSFSLCFKLLYHKNIELSIYNVNICRGTFEKVPPRAYFYFIRFATIARNPLRRAGALMAQMATTQRSTNQILPAKLTVIIAAAPKSITTLIQRRGKQSLNGIMRGASTRRKTSTKA